MAFLIQQVDGGRVPGIEYLPCGAITPKIGMALIQSGGNLAVASGTTAPTYVSMIEKETPCTAGDIIPVMRVLPDMMFETTFQAAASSVKLGDKVTLHTDGLQVTATTASGVAEVVGMDGTAAGDRVRVRFPAVVNITQGGVGGVTAAGSTKERRQSSSGTYHVYRRERPAGQHLRQVPGPHPDVPGKAGRVL